MNLSLRIKIWNIPKCFGHVTLSLMNALTFFYLFTPIIQVSVIWTYALCPKTFGTWRLYSIAAQNQEHQVTNLVIRFNPKKNLHVFIVEGIHGNSRQLLGIVFSPLHFQHKRFVTSIISDLKDTFMCSFMIQSLKSRYSFLSICMLNKP